MARARRARPNGGAPTDRPGRVLELTTRAGTTPGYVRIDGRTYDMADPSHFGLRAGGEIWRSVERIAALEAIAEPSDADEREYRERLERIARVAVPDLETQVAAKLATGQLADLVVSFFALVAATSPRLGLLMTAGASARTGTTSSPSSSASTAAT
ncbi:MAG TPA: hypothetical protein VFC31_12975 [Candidatus Limnocylindria bacterium]|nr:hypothetical protein [Candidatus Limnocylindria bacterium]